MPNIKNRKDELPDGFASYEEAGEFWDHHDSTDYLDQMTPVKMDAQLVRRRFEIELDEDVVEPLKKRAAIESLPASEIANKLLRKELISTP